MTGGKATAAVLRVGDRIRFDGVVQTVVGLSGTLVRLADEHGQTSVTRLPHLLTDASFERLGQCDGGRGAFADRERIARWLAVAIAATTGWRCAFANDTGRQWTPVGAAPVVAR